MTNKYKRIIANKIRAYGDIDTNKKLIRVNKKKSKRSGRGEYLDTIVHEEMHRLHPKAKEKTVQKMTTKKVKRMKRKTKNKMYSQYR